MNGLKIILISINVTLAVWVLLRVIYSLAITFHKSLDLFSSAFWQNFSDTFHPGLQYRLFGFALFIVILTLAAIFRNKIFRDASVK